MSVIFYKLSKSGGRKVTRRYNNLMSWLRTVDTNVTIQQLKIDILENHQVVSTNKLISICDNSSDMLRLLYDICNLIESIIIDKLDNLDCIIAYNYTCYHDDILHQS